MTVPSVNWNYPTAIKAGPGRIKELPDWCRELGMARPLLVTDPGSRAAHDRRRGARLPPPDSNAACSTK